MAPTLETTQYVARTATDVEEAERPSAALERGQPTAEHPLHDRVLRREPKVLFAEPEEPLLLVRLVLHGAPRAGGSRVSPSTRSTTDGGRPRVSS